MSESYRTRRAPVTIAAKCAELVQEDYDNEDDDDVPVTNNKGKEKSTVCDARSLSIKDLQDTMDKDIRRVANITSLEVRHSTKPRPAVCQY